MHRTNLAAVAMMVVMLLPSFSGIQGLGSCVFEDEPMAGCCCAPGGASGSNGPMENSCCDMPTEPPPLPAGDLSRQGTETSRFDTGMLSTQTIGTAILTGEETSVEVPRTARAGESPPGLFVEHCAFLT
jgi:hypothetical protein